MASEQDNKQNDVVAIELPAPSGWTKKFTPKRTGTPHKNDIVFVSPSGEEIKNKRQLDHYLKSHPGGPSASEFDWGTGDTPRRSSRLSEKSKAVVAPPTQSPKKKHRKSKGTQEENNAYADEEEDEATGKKGANEEETKENSTEDAKDTKDVEANTEEALQEITNTGDKETKTETGAASEETSALGQVDTDTKNIIASLNESNDASNVVEDVKIDEFKEAKTDESKEASTEVPGPSNDVPKDTSCPGDEATDGKIENNLEAKHAAEKPSDDSMLHGTTTGS